MLKLIKRIFFGFVGLILAFVALVIFVEIRNNNASVVSLPPEALVPNWSAIAAWPAQDAAQVAARPNPNRRVTAIVLDDSGSMGSDMEAAKLAVIESLGAMSDADRVAVVALNKGLVLPFTEVSEARALLPDTMRPITADGSTPLTAAIERARDLLEDEAAVARGFGTFRLIVTTDGAADNGDALQRVVVDLATTTPIQLATIGIGLSGRHVLARSDLGSFVDVANVEALRQALEAAVAENTAFTAITDFSEN